MAHLPAFFTLVLLLFSSIHVTATSIPSEQIDSFYANWERALEARAMRPQVPRMVEKQPPVLARANGREASDPAKPAGRNVVPTGETSPAPDIGAASAEVSASTGTPPGTAPSLIPTPALVPVKVAKVVNGKIVEVEVMVTPTPGPAPAPASATAEAQTPSVTGEMAILQNQLKMAAAAGKKQVKFSRGQLHSLLTEFQSARKKNPQFDKILPRSKALQVQATLQRSSSLAQGAEMPPDIARSLLKILFPPPQPQAPAQSQPPPDPLAEQSEDTSGLTEDNYYVEEGTEGDQPETYIDPQTGQEVYWDGTPVYPEGEYYEETYSEEGGEYNEEGEVYYEEGTDEGYYEEESTDEGNY